MNAGEVNGPIIGACSGIGIHDSEVFSFTGILFRIPSFIQFIFKRIEESGSRRGNRESFSLSTVLSPGAEVIIPGDGISGK